MTFSYLTIKIKSEIITPHLVTRDQGKKLLSIIISNIKPDYIIIIDFGDLETISPSFIDELFNGLKKELGDNFSKKIKVICHVPEWRKLIQAALKYRS